jgi:hypothetical protein
MSLRWTCYRQSRAYLEQMLQQRVTVHLLSLLREKGPRYQESTCSNSEEREITGHRERRESGQDI